MGCIRTAVLFNIFFFVSTIYSTYMNVKCIVDRGYLLIYKLEKKSYFRSLIRIYGFNVLLHSIPEYITKDFCFFGFFFCPITNA